MKVVEGARIGAKDVLDLVRQYGAPITVKEVAALMGLDPTNLRDCRDIANRLAYLHTNGLAERVGPGTYKALDTPRKEMTMTPTEPGSFACDECDKTYPTAHGVTMHKNRAHNAKAAQADELFERVGKATEALFPTGIPMSRLIEIADWQKTTLKMMAR